MTNYEEPPDKRHLTSGQREEILDGLQDSTTGPVSMTAAASDKEAVSYEAEIATVLKDMGCKVEIDNAKGQTDVAIPTGVEMTIKEETVRPIHASRIVRAFRRAGLAFVTGINARQRKNDTVYITVGANDAAAVASPRARMASPLRWWKAAFHW